MYGAPPSPQPCQQCQYPGLKGVHTCALYTRRDTRQIIDESEATAASQIAKLKKRRRVLQERIASAKAAEVELLLVEKMLAAAGEDT